MEISDFTHDLLGLQTFAERLEGFIPVEHDFVEGSLVIALSSKFGSGKSTFLKMWRKRLETGGAGSFNPLVVELNAWESDYYGDALLAIVSSLVDALVAHHKDGAAKTIINAAKDFGWFATAVAGQLVDKTTGINFVEAGKLAEEKKASRQGIDETANTFSMFKSRKSAMERLRRAITKAVEDAPNGVLFLVDELDRCRPDYAIAYLETIKHIFDVPNATFILAIDRRQLENSAKTAFGPNLDFDEYLRKFVQREIALPPMSNDGCEKLVSDYFNYYLERTDLRHCYFNTNSHQIGNILDLLIALQPTPRQLQEVFRIVGHLMSTSEKNAGRIYWLLGIGSIAMAALRICKPAIYLGLGKQQLDPTEAVKFLKRALGRQGNVEWWFTLFLTGGGLSVSSEEDIHKVLVSVGLRKGGDDTPHRDSDSTWDPGWRETRGSRTSELYGRIEHILGFG
ncbi:KAP family P-loop NTPase fold protein [Aeoliella sp. SH292]|uniref:KAP family P-loop NTPase fold protein n=1 Tax=Aeoliella sp. SH292 TaxID=3454464 RepID=UPI003F946879